MRVERGGFGRFKFSIINDQHPSESYDCCAVIDVFADGCTCRYSPIASFAVFHGTYDECIADIERLKEEYSLYSIFINRGNGTPRKFGEK